MSASKSLGSVILILWGALITACRPLVDSQAAEPTQAASGSIPLPLDFEIELYQGSEVFGADTVKLSEILEEGHPVVLNFWAGLCPPCRVEMPDFQALHQQYQGRVVVLGVDVGPFTSLGTRQEGMELLQQVGVLYPAGTTHNQEVVEAYRILGMPTTVFIIPEGGVVNRWTGLLTLDKMVELTDETLAGLN